MLIHARKLLTPRGWETDRVVRCENGRIVSVTPGTEGEMTAEKLVPGYFDIHCHGGEGYYTLVSNRELLQKYLLKLAACGVTDVLPGLSTYEGEETYRTSLAFLRQAMEDQKNGLLGGARIQGVHLEGPFLNPERSGAMNPDAMPAPSPELFDKWFGEGEDIIRMVTVAPERPGAPALIAHLLSKGINVQAGHTDATFDQANEAFALGVDSLCHTFNAARPIHHREPGVVTAALLDDNVFCEVICDFKHLHPGTIRMIYRMKGRDRMSMISDSVAVTGLPDGEHIINGKKYLIVDGTQRVKGGNTLSGGACYLDGGVRNLIGAGLPEEDVFRMASRTPAMRLKMEQEIGSVLPGAPAHMTAVDENNAVQFSVIGETVYIGK